MHIWAILNTDTHNDSELNISFGKSFGNVLTFNEEQKLPAVSILFGQVFHNEYEMPVHMWIQYNRVTMDSRHWEVSEYYFLSEGLNVDFCLTIS